MTDEGTITTPADFAAKIAHPSRLGVAFFYAGWSRACTHVDRLLADYQRRRQVDAMTLIRVDVERVPALAAQLGIKAVPSIFFFRGGHVVDAVVGEAWRGLIESKLNGLVKEPDRQITACI